MGSGNMEEVTCTVIGGVSYNQLCSPDFKVRDAPEEDSLTGSEYLEEKPDGVFAGNFFYFKETLWSFKPGLLLLRK